MRQIKKDHKMIATSLRYSSSSWWQYVVALMACCLASRAGQQWRVDAFNAVPAKQNPLSVRPFSTILRLQSSYLDGLEGGSSISYTAAIYQPTEEGGSDRNLDDIDFGSVGLAPGEVLPLKWDGQQISRNAFRVGMPPALILELQSYADLMGITEYYRDKLIDGHPLQPGTEREQVFGQQQHRYTPMTWLIQRPRPHWSSNMHWASPANEAAHDDFLKVLSTGGFDQVLEGIGSYFGLEALSAYHLSFIGVSQCEKGFIHADVNSSGRKAFNIIIPLLLEADADPELEIMSDDERITKFYKYRINAASMVGDDALHATAACDYRAQGGMRLAATVYVGDITTGNVESLLLSLTQAYPPPGNANHLLERAGNHWSRSDSSKRLPVR